MKALIWTTITILLTSCIATQTPRGVYPVDLTENTQEQEYNELSPFTFELHVPAPSLPFGQSKRYEGIAFIADYQIWTARHMYGRFLPSLIGDSYRIGLSPLKGLSICGVDHVKGDWMYFESRKNGTVWGVMMKAGRLMYTFSVDSQVIVGESGSPVMCFEHDKVMGVMSGLYPEERSWEGVRQALFVARFPDGSRIKRPKSTNPGNTPKETQKEEA